MDHHAVSSVRNHSDQDISCSMSSVAVALIRAHGGGEAVQALLREAGSRRSIPHLEDADNWISLPEACSLLAAGVRVSGEASFARRVGENTLSRHSGTQVATLLRSLGSVEAVLAAITRTAPRLSTVTEMEAIEASPGRAVVTARSRDGLARDPLHCEWTAGLLAGNPMLFGLRLADVHEGECQARGGARCVYTVTWDAELAAQAADPQLRVTALEAQLHAVSERLNSVYAVASDLLSSEDVASTLHCIVDRAADAVRAPSHVLAVRPLPTDDLQIYRRGISDEAARALTRASLSTEAPGVAGILVADVASARRTYGKLIASYPGQVEFFEQEREILDHYARHAAVVLDMALALQESAGQHQQVSSLLSLSHALAKAGTRAEVAQRLAAAVPSVVDCDRIAVWLWDEGERCLRSQATWRRDPGAPGELGNQTITPRDTPSLQSMLLQPHPLFFEDGTHDEFVAALMRSLGVIALSVVPIVARGAFLGILTVSVTERSERLRPDEDLLARLTGVAALAAPAIQNGQLVDQLRHRANHDGLTGLLNRVGFRQRIDSALDGTRAHEGRVGLLFVDLDDFKRVNDEHGHDAGDDLIRQVAARLRAICRGDDVVARLGGDEFAVILADVRREEQVRAAVSRVRRAFEKPFVIEDALLAVSASVGGGLFREDGESATDLVRRADAAMYTDKARNRRVRAGAAS
jgi:diguanylate cyclase (GGDEF)-like protein